MVFWDSFFLLALDKVWQQKAVYLSLAGLCLGASIAVKWNGLGFLIGLYLLYLLAWIRQLVQFIQNNIDKCGEKYTSLANADLNQTSLIKVTQLNVIQILFYLGILPGLVYSLLWLPHLSINSKVGFWELHKQMLDYHLQLGINGSNIHPYCSSWYTWPSMVRPILYLYETRNNTTELSSDLIPFPTKVGRAIYDVHGMGNPVLWWLSTAAILLLFLILLGMLAQYIRVETTISENNVKPKQEPLVQSTEAWIIIYAVVNYAANLLPWVKVTRCTFLYHYMSASIFSFLALAWIVEPWLRSNRMWLQATGVTIISLILLAFIFWMPIYLGLPLSPESFQRRIWFRSWL